MSIIIFVAYHLNAKRILNLNIFHSSNFLLVLALGLSSFTFLWNPLGFPPIKYEDGTYIGRAVHVLVAQTPQEGKFYDHPILANFFWQGCCGLQTTLFQ
jgi:hypothetical protein